MRLAGRDGGSMSKQTEISPAFFGKSAKMTVFGCFLTIFGHFWTPPKSAKVLRGRGNPNIAIFSRKIIFIFFLKKYFFTFSQFLRKYILRGSLTKCSRAKISTSIIFSSDESFRLGPWATLVIQLFLYIISFIYY